MLKIVNFLKHAKSSFDQKRLIGPAKWPHFDLFFVHKGTFYLTIEKANELTLTAPVGILIYPETFFTGRTFVPDSWASIQHFQIKI